MTLLVILLVTAVSLAEASVTAPGVTVAGNQTTRGLGAPAESVENKTYLHGASGHDGAHNAGSRVGAQHTAGPPLPPHGANHIPVHAPTTAEDTTTTKDIADAKTSSYKTKITYQKTPFKTPFTCAGGTCRVVGTSAGATTQNAEAEAKTTATTTTTTPPPRMCPANRPGKRTEMNPENHLVGAPRRLSPSPPARVDLATPGAYTIQDATETTEPPPSAPAINMKQNTADAGAAATDGAPPDILTSARSAGACSTPARQHLHTGHQDLPPEDSFTTTNKNTAKLVGRGSTMLSLARDDDNKGEVSYEQP